MPAGGLPGLERSPTPSEGHLRASRAHAGTLPGGRFRRASCRERALSAGMKLQPSRCACAWAAASCCLQAPALVNHSECAVLGLLVQLRAAKCKCAKHVKVGLRSKLRSCCCLGLAWTPASAAAAQLHQGG